MPSAGVDAALNEAQHRHAAALELCREQRYVAAEPLAREAWIRLQSASTPSLEAVAAFGHSLGTVLNHLGRLVEAEAIHRQAVGAAEELRVTGQLTSTLVGTLGGLGVTLGTLERFDDAEIHLRRALALAEICPDFDDAESAMTAV